MGRIHVIATGGTIAMALDKEAGGAVLALSGADFLKQLKRRRHCELPDISSEEYGPLPSSHFTVQHLWGLRQRVAAALSDPGVDGIVVTHGTDSLEETAYLLDLTVPGDKPMVVTGAMRVASEPGYEGVANLLSAVRVAASTDARGLGALVVLNEEIHAARDVTKTHSQSLDTFKSSFWGPLGRVEADRITIERRIARSIILCPHLEPNVALFKLVVGLGSEPLRDAVIRGVRGVVIESFGGGRVPPWWLEAIEETIGQGIAVVMTTRCPTGRVYDCYGYTGAYRDLVRVGCLFAKGLNGQKARVRLMAVLGATQNLQEAISLWTS